MTNKQTDLRKIWQVPWRYKEGFFIIIAILITGFSLELATNGAGIHLLSAPANIIAALVVLSIILVLHFFFRKHHAIKWLSSIPAAVTSLGLITFLVFLLGFTPQNEETVPDLVRRIGLSHLTESWPFALALMYFQLSLGLVALRRMLPLNKKNIGFALNHFGLWITITTGVFGAGDLQRLNYYLYEGEDFTNVVYDSKGEKYTIPVALKLKDFKIQDYPTKLFLYDATTGQAEIPEGENYFEVIEGKTSFIFDW